jgi:hypothetical protein
VGQQGSASGSLLLDLDGLQVVAAELVGGEWQLVVQTTATMVGCAGCGMRATPHGRRLVREVQAGDGGDLQGPKLDAAVGVLAGAVHHRDLPPRQADELGVQTGLVGLDDQQVAGAALDQEAGVVASGVHSVGGNNRTGKIQVGQQRLELGDLAAGGGHLALASTAPSWWSSAASRYTWWP